jgi:tetratricopeptide (TPR) repeat protein
MRLWIPCILISLTPLLAQDSPTPADARGWMNKGVQAYKNGQYEQAIEAFQKAIDLEPGNVNAHLYLGTAWMVTFIPGVELPDNSATAERARSEFLRVLGLEPGNQTALSSLAFLSLQEAEGIHDQTAKFRKLDDAHDWFLRVLSADPRNRDAYYSLGAIDWMKWYPNLMNARAKLGMKPEDPGPLTDAATRLDLRMKYGPTIEDGIANLSKALEIDPSYSDAMAYMNLLIRERADIRDSAEEYRSDIKEAEQWVQRALAAKRTAQTTGANAPIPPLPPARPTSDSTPTRIRVAGNVQSANLIQKIDPVYPPLAVQARVQGTVRFTAIIGKDGRIMNLQLIGGHPLLVQAAQDAVKQWVYQPTYLNGTPVEVVTQIDVPFTLPDAR